MDSERLVAVTTTSSNKLSLLASCANTGAANAMVNKAADMDLKSWVF